MAYLFYAAAFFSFVATVIHAACAIMAYKHWKASTSNPPEGFTVPPHAFYRMVVIQGEREVVSVERNTDA